MDYSINEIVILSGKGGTGKTSLSAALATIGDKKSIADCDVDAANLYLILQPENYYKEVFVTGFKAAINKNICIDCGKCISYCRFEAISNIDGSVCISETNCDGCKLCTHVCPVEAITMKPSNKSRWYIGSFRNGTMVHARLYPGEDNSGKLVNVVREAAAIEAFKLENHTVIIDGPPGIGCPAISSVTGARMAVVVTEPTKSGLHDLKRILELISNFKVLVCVIINKFDLNKNISHEIDLYCKESQIPVIGRIPFDTNIVMAMVHCKSIVEWAPNSPASKEIYSIYQTIFKE